jgi:hypothetical protein
VRARPDHGKQMHTITVDDATGACLLPVLLDWA